MHYHCEIVMPPTDNIVADIATVMENYYEYHKSTGEDDDYDSSHAFWDFYTIGGRYAGMKLIASFDKEKVDKFYEWMDSEQITVSSFTAGKQELMPASQIPKVDAKWNEMFRADTFVPCPIFKHSNDQYCKEVECTLPKDITTFAEVPLSMTCGRVIFCRPADEYGPLRAEFMLTSGAWNGCNFMPIKWDGTFGDALQQYLKQVEHYSEEFKAQVTPQDDWLVVTVDYHR